VDKKWSNGVLKLTESGLKGLTVQDADQWLSFGDGLRARVRVNADGSVAASFVLRYKQGGREHTQSVGTWPRDGVTTIRANVAAQRQVIERNLAAAKATGKTLTELRASREVKEQAARIEHERIVREEADRTARAAADALTVNDLYEAWLPIVSAKHPTLRKGRNEAGIRALKWKFARYVLPVMGATRLANFTASELRRVLRRVARESGNRMAVVLLTDLLQMVRFGERTQPFKRLLAECDALTVEEHHIVEAGYDPVADNIRTRRLTEAEIRTLATKLPASGVRDVLQYAVWIMLSCGTRVGETTKARWADVDLDAGLWTIPATTTKTNTALVVHLSDFARRQFEALHALTGTGPFVFPGTDPNRHMHVRLVGKHVEDRQRGGKKRHIGRTKDVTALELPGGLWRCHDLRRTCATMMQTLGVEAGIIDRCLNHAEPNRMRRIYMQHDYADDMRRAWSLLGTRLGILTSENVHIFSRDKPAA
jgi:integrase